MLLRGRPLRDSIALIRSIDHQRSDFGSGFIIKRTADATYWLTCAHVVVNVGGIDNLRIADYPATLVGCSEKELTTLKDTYDLVVLRVESLFKKVPLELVKPPKKKLNFSVTGHYQNQGAKQILADSLYGHLSTSDISVVTSEGYVKALELEVDSKSKLSFQPGYSGSPVFIKGTKQVIGVVAQGYTDGRGGFAISVEAAKRIFRKVPELQDILIKRTISSGIKVTEWFMTSIEGKLLESVSPDIKEALEWLRNKDRLAKQASDHVADISSSFSNIRDDVRLQSLEDFYWEIEKYLELVYASLLTDNETLLTQQTINPSRPIADYEIAFLWIKQNIPSNINHDVAGNIEVYLDCLLSNISYQR